MDILEIHKKYGIEIPEDKRDDFNKDFRASYKSAAEHKKVKDDLTDAQTKLATASDFEGKYNTLYRKYETDIAAKQAEIDEMKYDALIDKNLAKSGARFVNERVRQSVRGEMKAKKFKIADNGEELEGFDDYLKDLRKNEPDCFLKDEPFKKTNGTNTWTGGSSGVDKPAADSKANIFGRLL